MSVLYLKNNQGIWEEVSTINGHTPVITASKSNGITTIYADGTTVATINDGEKGEKGEDGETPLSAFPNDTVSGQIVHITDGADDIPMDSVKVKIEPVQDLHGQNNPYPAGGGKNILDLEAYIASRTSNYTVDSDGWITFNPALASVYANKWVVGDLKTRSAILLIDTATQLDGVKLRVYNGDTVVAATPSGNPSSSKIENREFDRISFDWTTSSDNTKTVKVKVAIVDEATIDAWSPYSNICPISGWTGVNVVRTGKNLFDIEEYLKRNNITYEKDGDSFTFTPKQSMYNNPWRFAKKDSVISASVQSLTNITASGIKLRFLNDSGTTVFTLDGSTNSVKNIVASSVRADWVTGGLAKITAPQIEFGAENTSYEPYTGDTYSITLPTEAGTVYGGTLDVTNGTLTVDRAMVDLGTLDWITPTDNRFYTTSLSSVIKKGTDGALWIQSSMFRTVTSLNIVYNSTDTMWLSAQGNISVSKIVGTTTELIAEITGQQLVYKLATPIVYTLTPTEIKSLYGENNIYADCGSTSVTYRADTTSYIGKIITATKSGTVTTVYVKDKPIATINDGTNGKDYTLTTQDKADIAQQVINILPTAQGVSF